MSYHCPDCNYTTNIKTNFKKHILTKKHLVNQTHKKDNFKENSNQKNEKVSKCSINVASYSISNTSTINAIKCIHCNKIFKHHSSLYRHRKKCYGLESNNNCKDKAAFTVLNHSEAPRNTQKDPENCKNDYSMFFCKFCQNSYSNSRSLGKHLRSCSIKFLNQEKNNIILMKDLEREKAVNTEKDRIIEIAKKSKNNFTTNITNNNNSINYLNTHYGNMIAMEQFLYNLEHHEKLTFDERNNLLLSYKENGIDVFARNFSYIMKENCKRQLEKKGISDMKLLPLFCSDGNLRSHKEKSNDGWKTHYDNKSINQMLNISSNQVYETYNEMIPIIGKERSKIYNEIKRDNHQNKLKLLTN